MAKEIVEKLVAGQPWIDQVADAVQPLVNKLFSNAGEGGRARTCSTASGWGTRCTR